MCWPNKFDKFVHQDSICLHTILHNYIMMLYTSNYYLLYIITICIAWTIDSCSDLVLEKYDVS